MSTERETEALLQEHHDENDLRKKKWRDWIPSPIVCAVVVALLVAAVVLWRIDGRAERVVTTLEVRSEADLFQAALNAQDSLVLQRVAVALCAPLPEGAEPRDPEAQAAIDDLCIGLPRLQERQREILCDRPHLKNEPQNLQEARDALCAAQRAVPSSPREPESNASTPTTEAPAPEEPPPAPVENLEESGRDLFRPGGPPTTVEIPELPEVPDPPEVPELPEVPTPPRTTLPDLPRIPGGR